VPPGTRACLAADVVATETGFNGAGGRLYDSITLTDVSATPCLLSGVPRAALLDQAGHEIAMQTMAEPAYGLQPAYLQPKAGSASLAVGWPSRDDLGCSTTGLPASAIEIWFPDAPLKVALGRVPVVYPCAGPLGVTPFQLTPVAEDTPPPSLPPVQVRLSAPSAVKPGAVLNYTVTLTNTGSSTIDLRASCPNYEEELFPIGRGSPLGGKHFYALNCADAGLIAPGGSLTFAMQLPVAPGAVPGVYKLTWLVGLGNAMTVHAETPVRVG
jgi:hypothetical protein